MGDTRLGHLLKRRGCRLGSSLQWDGTVAGRLCLTSGMGQLSVDLLDKWDGTVTGRLCFVKWDGTVAGRFALTSEMGQLLVDFA